jgi:hypothetical protein
VFRSRKAYPIQLRRIVARVQLEDHEEILDTALK